MKRLRYLLYPLALVVVTAAVLAWYALATTGGARAVLHRALPDAAFDRLEGSLLGGLVVEDLRFAAGGTVVSSAHLDLDLDWDILPPRLIVQRLAAREIALGLSAASTEAGSGSTGRLDWPDLRLPIAIEIVQLDLADLLLSGGSLATPLAINALSAQADLDDRLVLTGLHIGGIDYAGKGGDLTLTGALDLAPPYAHTLDLLVEPAANAADTGTKVAPIRLEAEGSLRAWRGQVTTGTPWPAELVVHLDDPGHHLARHAVRQLPWRAELTAATVFWPPDEATYEARDLDLTAAGTMENFRLAGRWHLGRPAVLDGEWRLQAAGSVDTLRLEQLTGETAAGAVTVSGQYETRLRRAAGEVRFDTFDPARLAPALAPLGAYSGTLPLTWQDGAITLTGGHLRGAGGARLDLDGQYSAAQAEEVGLSVTWRDLRWTGDETRRTILSPAGELKLSGTRADYRLDGAFALQAGDLPAGQLAVALTGRDTEIQLDHLDGHWLAGRWRLMGTAQLTDPLTARAELRAEGIDPGQLWPAWPGSIDSTLVLGVESGPAGLTADLDLQRLGGELRGEALAGSGRIRYHAGRIATTDLEITAGGAGLRVSPLPEPAAGNGATPAAEPSAVPPAVAVPIRPHRLTLELPDIHTWVPQWHGRVHATLEIEAPQAPGFPPLRWTLDARDGAYRDLSVARIRSAGRCCSASGLPGTGRLTLEGVAYHQQQADRLVADWQTDAAARSLDIVAEHAGDRLAIRLGAGGGPLDQPLAGRLETLDLNHADLGVWQLEKPAEWTVEPAFRRLRIAPCLVRTGTAATLCADADVTGDSQSLAVRIDALNMDLPAAASLPWQIREARFSGSAAWRSARGAAPEVELHAALTPGRLEHRLFPSRTIAIERLTLAANGSEAHGYDLTFDAGTEIGGTDGRIRLAAWPWADDQSAPELSGFLRLTVPDLAALQRLAPALGIKAGRLDAGWDLGGTLAQPELVGKLAVTDGAYTNPASGLAADHVQLTLAGQHGQRLDLNGQFTMGEGQGTISGTFDAAEPRLDIELHGQRLTLLDGAAGRLLASPAVALGWQPGQVAVTGRIDLPEGELKPQVGEVIKPSADVVIEGAEADNASPPIAITGRLTIAIGEGVRVRAPAARAALAGTLDLEWDSSKSLPHGTGQITLTQGQIRAYGQNLELRRGRILFERVPVDEPRLDIRAAREIFGDPLVREAGVEVTGTARRPVVRLYTEPPGDQENALAYLLTGSNFDYGNGEGALAIGVYLMPRLWVSYGVGLFESSDVTSARYQFSRRWSVRVVSGARDTGADLSWSIDR